MDVPDGLRYTEDHEWLRVEGDEGVVGITAYAADELGDVVFVELPAVGPAAGGARGVRRHRVGEDRERPVRARGGRGGGRQRRPGGRPGAGQQRPLRRGLDDPPAPRRPGASRRASWTPPPTASGSPRADPMAYGPHTGRRPRADARGAGHRSVDALFEDIPAAVRAQRHRPARRRSPSSTWRGGCPSWRRATATDLASFLGAGVYRHHIPATVDAILSRGEFYTAYTPYQPEISQGTLQTIFEYQSLLAELTGLPVVSASHYDGAAATAEAALMTIRATGRRRVLVSRAVHRHYVETTRTYFAAGGARARRAAHARRRHDRPGRARGGARPTRRGRSPASSWASPTRSASWSRWRRRLALAHAAGALFVAVVEPVSLAVLASPGDVRRGHRCGRGPAAGHRAAVRRARTWASWPRPSR